MRLSLVIDQILIRSILKENSRNNVKLTESLINEVVEGVVIAVIRESIIGGG